MTSAEDYPDHVDDAEQLLRAVLTRHHIERIPLPDGTLRLRISRDFFLPFRSDEIGLSAFRELAGKDTIRRHADSMFSYCGFGRTQCADMREIDLSRPLVLNACRHAALLWLLVAVACVYWHFGKGSASRPASPSAPPISADCRVDGMPAGGIAGRGIGCVHADRPSLPEGVPAVGPMIGKERG